MNPEASRSPQKLPPLWRNWWSLTGLVIAGGALFSFLLLFVLDLLARFGNPYLGVLTYLVAPAFMFLGLGLTLLGMWRERRRRLQGGAALPHLVIDLTRPRDRRILTGFVLGALGFLFLSAVGSYHTYHFTESTQFCGQVCHTVMEPQWTTYQQGPHARVDCVQCHIGPGATWFVRSKLSGTYQVYATLANKYPRPIPTPIKNLRPARETCEQCHWPQKFIGDLDRTFHYFLADETNTPFVVRMTMKVGGSDPRHGPVGGIHWHVNPTNIVQYIAARWENGQWVPDPTRQSIPWVRLVDGQGVVLEFRKPGFTNDPNSFAIRTMDCMDCHNRPAHQYRPPTEAVDRALLLGRIDPTLPWIKSNAVYALTLPYTNRTEALQRIATFLAQTYPPDLYPQVQHRVREAIAVVQEIYRQNFFPEMRASWEKYPDHSGHMYWPGCFRCHEGKHATADGKRVITHDCNACHTILAQGHGDALRQLTPEGQPFRHPGDEVDGGCYDCHTGGL